MKKIKTSASKFMTGAMILTSLGAPVNVLANSKLQEAEGGGYKFTYSKSHTNEDTKHNSLYALRMKKGKDKTGAPFEIDEEDVKKSTILLENAKDKTEKVAEVKYDGLYELVHVQREPGFYAVDRENMHKEGDDGLFDFPNRGEAGMDEDTVWNHEQKVEMKEAELLAELEVILQNDLKRGLSGEFELTQIARPESVYSRFTQDEIQSWVNEDELGKMDEQLNAASNEEETNQVKSWEEVEGVKATIKTLFDKKADEIIGLELEEIEMLGDNEENTEGLPEGVYKLSQTKTSFGYNKRPDLYFVITVDETGAKPELKLAGTEEEAKKLLGAEKGLDEISDKKAHEQFKLDKDKSLYQALLVNFTKPGFRPTDPTDPDNPDPDNPNNYPSIPSFLKEAERTATIVEDLSDYVNKDKNKGQEVAVNVGEKFDYNFDFYVPENIETYTMLKFHDIFDEKIVVPSDVEIEVKVGDTAIEGFVKEDTGDNNNIKLDFSNLLKDEDFINTVKGKDLSITIKDVHLKTDTVDDVKNKAFIYFESETDKAEEPENHETPKPEDPHDPNNPNEPNDPNNPNDPQDPTKPVYPTTPEVVVDPITVDFRVAVVDGQSKPNLLDDAIYKIKEFTPTRGDGELREDGLYIDGNKLEHIPIEIDTSKDKQSFVSLEKLPAGKYVFEEIKAPVKGDDQYRLVTSELEFIVHEDEDSVTIKNPIVQNGNELSKDVTLSTKEVYEDGGFDSDELLDKDAMIRHYKYITPPATGTLARVPFFIGGGIAVAAGAYQLNKKKEER